MTTETRQRIRAYKRMLPDLRERVIAVALLLAMSASMLGSASFAWITLSRAPEVSGMSTTVAANGNLEIALAQGSISDPLDPPEESAVGDSSAAEEQTIVGANATWGNLVNVSDPSYGLSQIALRPALLSDYNRKDYPLNGATYGGDGRVISTNDRYAFASYTQVAGSDTYFFAAGSDAEGNSLVNYGVRAIASIGTSNASGNVRVEKYEADTIQYYKDAQSYYGKIVTTDKNEVNTLNEATGVTCISALEGLVKVFAQDKINKMGYGNGSDIQTSCSPHLWYLYQMMLRLETALTKEGQALLEMANWQAYIASGDDKRENTFTSISELTSKSTQQLAALGVQIDCLTSYKTDVANLQKAINGIKPMAEKCSNPNAPEEEYYWDDIAGYVNLLVDIGTCTLGGTELNKLGASEAIGIVTGGRKEVIAYKGVLQNVEKRMVDQGNRVKANVSVTVYVSLLNLGDTTVKGIVYTDAGKRNVTTDYSADMARSAALESTAIGEASAKDTYGMALDVWLRTNYPGAVLTLEGAVKYKDERATITVTVDGADQVFELSTITVNEVEMDVYQRDGTWYYASNHNEVDAQTLESQTPNEKFNQIIIGYEGENRIWEDWRAMLSSGYIEQDATTQGSGSCFVFYANSPAEKEKIKEMLKAFNVAFIDQNGDILGTAILNLDSAYENQGKITVPLEVDSGVEYTDESGKTRVGITTLAQNQPKLITAVIYLNGSKLQNENVLAEGELQGQLNIQFGTNSTLIAPENEDLQSQARTITATVAVDVNGTLYTTTNDTIGLRGLGGTDGLEYKAAGYPTTVTLNVTGEQPEKISGFFVRVINDSQGTRGEEIKFTPNGDGTWTGAFTKDENDEWTVPLKLTNPGTYAFNTLLVDGVQYTLHDGTVEQSQGKYYPANRPKVNIKGLNVTSISVDMAPGTHMTADPIMPVKVTAVVDAAVEPRQVNAQFFSGDNQFTAILSRVGTTNVWEGTANISASGTYSLDFVSVDGTVIGVTSPGTYTIYLGMIADVYTDLARDQWEFEYTGPTQIKINANVYDDAGGLISNQKDVKLYYNNVISPAGMIWVKDHYEGVLDITQPGELTFQKIEMGTTGTVRRANSDAPKFLAISLETPSYVSANAPSQQSVIGSGTAAFTVQLKDAETAKIWAEVQHGNDTLYVPADKVEGTSGNTRTFTLSNPTDGEYTLKRLFMQTVYNAEEEKWYANTNADPTSETESDYFILDTDVITTEVIATYTVQVFYDDNGDGSIDEAKEKKLNNFTVNLSGTAASPTGTLFQGYSPSTLMVKVTDYKGRGISGVEKSTLKVNYNNATDTEYGGYDGAPVSQHDVTFTVSADGTTLTANTWDSFVHSGVYTAAINLNVAGLNVQTVTPTFTVATVKPTATITGINPSGINVTEITFTTGRPSGLGASGTVPTFTTAVPLESTFSNYAATVYALPNVKNDTQRHGNFDRPKVTIKVAGLNTDIKASIVLPGSGNVGAVTFTRTGNGEMTATLGAIQENYKQWTSKTLWVITLTHSLNAYLGHGTQTISTMTVTRGGVDYTVTLDNPLVITNPSSVNH